MLMEKNWIITFSNGYCGYDIEESEEEDDE
jgi:hypothetical protein